MTESPYVHKLTEEDVSGPPLGTPTVSAIVEDLRPRWKAALERHAHGELIRFEMFMFPLPTEQRDEAGNHQVVAMLGVYVEIKGAVLNTQISATRVMQPNGHTDEVVDAHARETVEGLLGARSQQLRQQTIDAEAARERGEAPPTGGMIHPDGSPNPSWDDAMRAMNGFARGE